MGAIEGTHTPPTRYTINSLWYVSCTTVSVSIYSAILHHQPPSLHSIVALQGLLENELVRIHSPIPPIHSQCVASGRIQDCVRIAAYVRDYETGRNTECCKWENRDVIFVYIKSIWKQQRGINIEGQVPWLFDLKKQSSYSITKPSCLFPHLPRLSFGL